MSDDSTTRVVSDSGDDIGPGQRLREAREAAQLTSAEVASRMRLEPHIVDLLESDNYEALHGPTFVRGYLSGYARLLNLPERPILEAYERHGFGPPALVSELGGNAEVHISDFPVRMTTYVIAGLLVVLVVMWWQSRQAPTDAPEIARTLDAGNEAGETQPGAAATDPPITVQEPAGVMETSTTTEPETLESPPAPAATMSDAGTAPDEPLTAAAEPAGVDTVDEAEPARDAALADAPREQPEATTDGGDTTVPPPDPATENAASEPAPAAAEVADSGAEQVAAIIESAVVESTGADTGAETGAPVEEEAAPPRPEPLPGSDVLAIQLQRESWIEIYDRGGGRLYYSLAREGSEIVVQGAGPMRVLLGDVEGVAVAYNGEPFDLSRYEGRSVVRFTIGESTSTTPAAPPSEEPTAPEPAEPTAREREQTAAVVPETIVPETPVEAEAGFVGESTPAAAIAPPPPARAVTPDS